MIRLQVRGRIIAVDYESKTTRISLLPHIVHYKPYRFPDDVHVGKKYEDALVTAVSKRGGITLELPTEPTQKAFVLVCLQLCLAL